MSVATRNPFALLDEDDARPASPPPLDPPQPPQHPSAAQHRPRGGPTSRGGGYYPRGGSRPNIDRDPPSSEDPPAPHASKQRRSDGERREGRGRGRGPHRGRGRTFDRHSATGKTDSDKKLHNGWGGDDGNTELKVEEAASFDVAQESAGLNDWAAPADTSAGDWGAPSQEPAPEQSPDADKLDNTRRRDRDPKEEDNTLTLDQYIARQKEDSALLPRVEARKIDDGETAWDGATRLEKGQGESYFSGKTKSAPKARTEKKEKVFLEIQAHFDRPARGNRGRGSDRTEGRGRGGARGRGPRGRGAANGAPHPSVDVDDETAFPCLS